MEQRKDDPLELWVGSWMPEDVIDRETRRLAEHVRGGERERPDEDHRK